MLALKLTPSQERLLQDHGIVSFEALEGMILAAPDAAKQTFGEDFVQRVLALATKDSPPPPPGRLGAKLPESRSKSKDEE